MAELVYADYARTFPPKTAQPLDLLADPVSTEHLSRRVEGRRAARSRPPGESGRAPGATGLLDRIPRLPDAVKVVAGGPLRQPAEAALRLGRATSTRWRVSGGPGRGSCATTSIACSTPPAAGSSTRSERRVPADRRGAMASGRHRWRLPVNPRCRHWHRSKKPRPARGTPAGKAAPRRRLRRRRLPPKKAAQAEAEEACGQGGCRPRRSAAAQEGGADEGRVGEEGCGEERLRPKARKPAPKKARRPKAAAAKKAAPAEEAPAKKAREEGSGEEGCSAKAVRHDGSGAAGAGGEDSRKHPAPKTPRRFRSSRRQGGLPPSRGGDDHRKEKRRVRRHSRTDFFVLQVGHRPA